MSYEIPTTREEMYATLKQIYYDYRLKIDAYEDAGLRNIQLERLEPIYKTRSEMENLARDLFMPWYYENYNREYNEIENKIFEVEKNIEEISYSTAEKKANANAEYEKSRAELKREAEKNGFINSSLYLDKLEELELKRIDALAKIDETDSVKTTNANSQKKALKSYQNSLSDYYDILLEEKVHARVLEYIDEEEKLQLEVFKYNNSLDEKEQRSRNANISANASLKLRYLEIRTKSYSREELVDMGYYEDVVTCVCGYYNTITNTMEAYNEFKNDTKVIIYLEDYYSNVLQLYRDRAGM